VQVAAACDKWRKGEGQQQGAGSAAPAWLLAVTDTGTVTSHPLNHWAQLRASSTTTQVLLAFADTSNLPSYPGWPLRNLLLLAAVCWRVREVEVVCVRESRGVVDAQRSLLLRVSLPQVPHGWYGASTQPVLSAEVPALQGLKALAAEAAAGVGAAGSSHSAGSPVVSIGGNGSVASAGAPEAVGWEANAEGKVAPRYVRHC
jgi:ubiquitin-like modifier-activating enzyme ATG7